MIMFADRSEAGRRLAARLDDYRTADPLILALPRGGVPVAAEIARALGGTLDLLIVRKIGVPGQPELAMGAVADAGDPLVVRNEDVIRLAGVSEDEFTERLAHEVGEIQRRRQRYTGGRAAAPVPGRTVIVVDDGVATGATARAALRALRTGAPGRLVLAVPVAASAALDDLAREADEIVCLSSEDSFVGVGGYYLEFPQLSDDEVIAALAQSAGGR